jgi:hypothetical protein
VHISGQRDARREQRKSQHEQNDRRAPHVQSGQ